MQKLGRDDLNQIFHFEKIPIRLAFIKSNTIPNVLSLWYVYLDEKIYCATQKSAKIVSYLETNPKCGFEIAADKPPYKGVSGEDIAKILPENGENILNLLMNKYLGTKESTLSKFLKNNSKTEVAIEIIPSKVFYYDYSKRMNNV